jgi:hypothetical protein
MKEIISSAMSSLPTPDALLPADLALRPTSADHLSAGILETLEPQPRAPSFGMLAFGIPASSDTHLPMVEGESSGLAARSEGPQADHKLIRSFVSDALAKGLCSEKTLSHHVTALNALSRWLAAPAQRQRLAGGLRGLLQRMSQGRSEAAAVAGVLREFRRSNPSADVKRRINYAFNALCKVTGAGAVVSESSFLDVSIEDAAVIRRFRRAAQSTPGNNAKTLANISVALKHLAKWLAQRGSMDLKGLQECMDESEVTAVVRNFRADASIPAAAKSRTGAAVKALRASAGGTVLLSTRLRHIGEVGRVGHEAASLA